MNRLTFAQIILEMILENLNPGSNAHNCLRENVQPHFTQIFLSPHHSTRYHAFRQCSHSLCSLRSPTFYPASISVNVRGGCVSMATGFATGLWEVKECASSKAKFICRQNQDTSLSPEPPVPQPTPSLSGSCPSGWKTNNNLRYCYKVHHQSPLKKSKMAFYLNRIHLTHF